MNRPPSHCPYCGTAVDPVDSPMLGAADTPMVYTLTEFDAADLTLEHTHVDRFGEDSLEWLRDAARRAIDARPTPPR